MECRHRILSVRSLFNTNYTFMLRFIAFAVIALAASPTLIAQQPSQTIRGTVIDHASGNPLAHANIVILNANLGTFADSLGNFVLSAIRVGRYDIQVSMTGYEPFVIREVVV